MSSELVQSVAFFQGASAQAGEKKSQISGDTPAVLFFELLTSSFAAQASTSKSVSAGELISPSTEVKTTATGQEVKIEHTTPEPSVRTESTRQQQTSTNEPRQESTTTTTRSEAAASDKTTETAPRESDQPARQQTAEEPQQNRNSEDATRAQTQQQQVQRSEAAGQAKAAVVQETPKQSLPNTEALRAEVQRPTTTNTQQTTAATVQETVVKEATVTRPVESALLGAEASRAVKAETQQPAVQDFAQFLGKTAVRSAEAVQPSVETQTGNQAGGEQQGGNSQSQQSTANVSAADVFAQALSNGAENASANAVKQVANVTGTQATMQVQSATGAQTVDSPVAGKVPTQQQGVAEGQKTEQTARSQQPVPAERVIRQVVQAARISISQGREEIKLVLKPDSLGTLRVKITVEGERVTAHITAENENVRSALESNVRQLQQALESQNLRVNQIVVSLQGDGQAQQQADQSGQQGHGGVQQGNQLAEEETELVASDAEQGGETERVSQVDLRV